MRIGPPSIIHQQGSFVLSANIDVKTSDVTCPGSLWFATQGEESYFLPDMADAFVVGLIASAMYLGEDIWVEGMVSTRVAHGLETYQNVLSTWWPNVFKCVDIHYESLVEHRQDLRPKGVGCTFSGGLDSYHAMLQLLPSNTKYNDFSITHALMINGFDQLYDPKRHGVAPEMYNCVQPSVA